MPSINLADNLGLNLSITNGDSDSTLSKYLLSDLKFLFDVAKFKDNQSVAVSQVPRNVLPLTLSSKLTSSFGIGGSAGLTVSEGVTASISVLTGDDSNGLLSDFGRDSAAPPVYLAFETGAKVTARASASVNEFTFGMVAGGEIDVTNYRACDPSTPLVDATRATISDFTIPIKVEDLEAMSPGTVFQVEGRGTLTFSVAAGYEFLNNPLATIKTPLIKPPVINASGSADLEFSVQIFGGFQVSVLKDTNNTVLLAASRSRGKKFALDLSVTAGLTATAFGSDLLSKVLGQISPDPEQIEKLKGLPPANASSIEAAIKAALESNLAAGVTTEIAKQTEKDVFFLYELNLSQLTGEEKKSAVSTALRGDYTQISELAATTGSGIVEKQAVYTRKQKTTRSLTIHLLNLFQFTDISSLVLNGKVQVSPDSGALVITDTATANQIRATTSSLYADAKKLRALLFTSSIVTAAYQGSMALVGAPTLSFRFEFFTSHADTRTGDMRHELATLAAINSIQQAQMNSILSSSGGKYGATSLNVGMRLDALNSERLFLAAGKTMPSDFYETLGRNAMSTLLQGDTDPTSQARLGPLTNPDAWKRISDILKNQGTAGFETAFENLSPSVREDILGDHEVISWWAQAMSGFGSALQQIQKAVKDEGGFKPESDQFKKIQKDFEQRAGDVVSTTKDRFDLPWGLLAIYFALLPEIKADVSFTSAALTLGPDAKPVTAAVGG